MVDDYQEDFYLKGENEYFEKVRIGFLEKERNSHSDTIYLFFFNSASLLL